MHTLKVISEDEETGKFPIERAAAEVYSVLGQKCALAVEVAFVTPSEIRSLNAEYRNTDKVTDVLSFPYIEAGKKVVGEDEYADEKDAETGDILIGSVAVCIERAAEQAKEYGHSLKREVVYLAVHGMLHCFGYDHITEEEEKEMTAVAEKVMERLGLQRI